MRQLFQVIFADHLASVFHIQLSLRKILLLYGGLLGFQFFGIGFVGQVGGKPKVLPDIVIVVVNSHLASCALVSLHQIIEVEIVLVVEFVVAHQYGHLFVAVRFLEGADDTAQAGFNSSELGVRNQIADEIRGLQPVNMQGGHILLQLVLHGFKTY